MLTWRQQWHRHGNTALKWLSYPGGNRSAGRTELPAATRCPAPSYQPRRSHETPLYALVLDHHEKFESCYEERYASRYGALRAEVVDAFRGFLDCGVLAHGFLRVRCRGCGYEMQVPWSCKRATICPGCGQRRSLEFGQYVDEAVLEAVPYRHVVVTMPKLLRPAFLRDRSLLGDLVTCVWRTLCQGLSTALGQAAAKPGAIIGAATAGDMVNRHVHVHCIVSCGAWLAHPQGGELFLPWPLRLTPANLEELFRRKLLSMLLRRERVSETTVERLLAWNPSGFSCWLGTPIEPEQRESRQRLARYIVRPVVSLERLNYDPARCQVEYRSDARGQRRTMSALDFLVELSAHVPNRGRHSVHYLGRCSSRSRGERRKALAEFEGLPPQRLGPEPVELPPGTGGCAIPLPPTLSRKAFRIAWAALLKKVYNIDLRCPRCGTNMKIVAAITDLFVAQRILKHLGLFQRPRAPNRHECASDPPWQLRFHWQVAACDRRAWYTPLLAPDAIPDQSEAADQDRDPHLDDWPVADPPFPDD